jgi:hypothetical protein
MTTYIKPECMPYIYDENGNQNYNTKLSQGIAYTADGYLLPCCWCDAPSTRKDFVELGFYNESLKLSNNKSVEDILYTGAWKKFIKIIMHDSGNAPRCCREKCGVKND